MRKISKIHGETESAFSYEHTYSIEGVNDGRQRLRIGAASGFVDLLVALALELEQPFQLLFILHTSRSGSPLGRYQSPTIDALAMREFISANRDFLEVDARHDLWVHSANSESTLVLTRTNLLFAYGDLDSFRRVLDERGFAEAAAWAAPTPPKRVALHYHAAFDESERSVLGTFIWNRTPLRPEDVQRWTGPESV